MTECKVSVCIPTYNYASFMSETIESILNQSLTDFELIIIDDNSTDDTRSVVEAFAREDSRIRFSVNSSNVGMVENWNLCIARARGDYIKFVFGDDLLASPDALERMAAQLDADSSVSLVASARNVIDEHSRVLTVWSDFEATAVLPGTLVINRCLPRQQNLIGEPSVVMFRKAQAARGFLVKYRQIVDLEMWFHLLEQGSFAYINEPLCSFRLHEKQQTARHQVNPVHLNDLFYLMEDYCGKSYVNMSRFMRKCAKNDCLYWVWKFFRDGMLNRKAALELINTYDDFASFVLWFPLYMMFRPFLKIYKKRV